MWQWASCPLLPLCHCTPRPRAADQNPQPFDYTRRTQLTRVQNTTKPYGVRLTPQLITMKAKMEGFIAFDYEKRYPEARVYLADLAKRGLLKYDYHIVQGGLDGCVPSLIDLFAGNNVGKTVVQFPEVEERNTKL